MRKTVSGVDLVLNANGGVWIYQNTKNKASFIVSKDEDFFYEDPFGNYMSSSPRNIRINLEYFALKSYGDEIRRPDGTAMIMLCKEEIQEIANKTFYEEDQFHPVDFVTFTITEEK